MKKKFILVTLVLILLSVSGCYSSYELNDGNNSVDETKSPDISETNKELAIYTINDDTYECIPSISLIPKDAKVDAELIVNEVIANFKENVVVLNIEEQPDSVAVYFSENSAPVINVSEQVEESMLDCIACSLLDNLDYCNEVYFRCGTDNYKSSNIELEYNEPYISK